MEPAKPEHRAVCASVSGLICVDPTCLPTSLRLLEADLSYKASFARFLKALSKLRTKNGPSVQSLFVPKLAKSVRQDLRWLLNHFLDTHAVSEIPPDTSVIRALPIWTPVRRGNTTPWLYFSAEKANFCPHRPMFMEWVRDLDTYVDPTEAAEFQGNSRKLGIFSLSAAAFWLHVKRHLPQTLDAQTRADYLRLLDYLQTQCRDFATANPPNGNGALCNANSLYDRDEAIFASAFREQQAERFVHLDLWAKKDYWLSVGLRCRQSGELTSQDYLQSCQAASKQSGPLRQQSLAKVATYLDYEKAVFRTWPEAVWTQLSKISMFPVKMNPPDQLQFRKAQMTLIAKGPHFCSLDKAGQLSDIRIIWSQLKILERPPAAGVFDLIPGGGRPSVSTVFQHLLFLTSICRGVSQGYELAQYLEDIKACYGYMQLNVALTKTLPNIRSAKIWFNADTSLTNEIRKESLLPNLLSASEICLDAPGKRS